jgi:hypothetical protein
MKFAFLLIPAVLILAVGCSKSGSGTKPSLSIESFNNPVDSGVALNVNLKFTNGNSLGSGANFLAIRVRLNVNPILGGGVASGGDTILTPVPAFSNVPSGEFVYTMPYLYLSTGGGQNDTLMFKFAAITSSNVSSDTISTKPIVIINP